MEQTMQQTLTAILSELHNINGRFEHIDTRLDGIDSRLDGIDNRLDDMDKRFDVLENRMDDMDKRFDVLENRVNHLEERFDHMEIRIDRLEQGQAMLIQNTATILNAITIYSHEEHLHYTQLSGRIQRLEQVQRQHSIDIMELRAAR